MKSCKTEWLLKWLVHFHGSLVSFSNVSYRGVVHWSHRVGSAWPRLPYILRYALHGVWLLNISKVVWRLLSILPGSMLTLCLHNQYPFSVKTCFHWSIVSNILPEHGPMWCVWDWHWTVQRYCGPRLYFELEGNRVAGQSSAGFCQLALNIIFIRWKWQDWKMNDNNHYWVKHLI